MKEREFVAEVKRMSGSVRMPAAYQAALLAAVKHLDPDDELGLPEIAQLTSIRDQARDGTLVVPHPTIAAATDAPLRGWKLERDTVDLTTRLLDKALQTRTVPPPPVEGRGFTPDHAAQLLDVMNYMWLTDRGYTGNEDMLHLAPPSADAIDAEERAKRGSITAYEAGALKGIEDRMAAEVADTKFPSALSDGTVWNMHDDIYDSRVEARAAATVQEFREARIRHEQLLYLALVGSCSKDKKTLDAMQKNIEDALKATGVHPPQQSPAVHPAPGSGAAAIAKNAGAGMGDTPGKPLGGSLTNPGLIEPGRSPKHTPPRASGKAEGPFSGPLIEELRHRLSVVQDAQQFLLLNADKPMALADWRAEGDLELTRDAHAADHGRGVLATTNTNNPAEKIPKVVTCTMMMAHQRGRPAQGIYERQKLALQEAYQESQKGAGERPPAIVFDEVNPLSIAKLHPFAGMLAPSATSMSMPPLQVAAGDPGHRELMDQLFPDLADPARKMAEKMTITLMPNHKATPSPASAEHSNATLVLHDPADWDLEITDRGSPATWDGLAMLVPKDGVNGVNYAKTDGRPPFGVRLGKYPASMKKGLDEVNLRKKTAEHCAACASMPPVAGLTPFPDQVGNYGDLNYPGTKRGKPPPGGWNAASQAAANGVIGPAEPEALVGYDPVFCQTGGTPECVTNRGSRGFTVKRCSELGTYQNNNPSRTVAGQENLHRGAPYARSPMRVRPAAPLPHSGSSGPFPCDHLPEQATLRKGAPVAPLGCVMCGCGRQLTTNQHAPPTIDKLGQSSI